MQKPTTLSACLSLQQGTTLHIELRDLNAPLPTPLGVGLETGPPDFPDPILALSKHGISSGSIDCRIARMPNFLIKVI